MKKYNIKGITLNFKELAVYIGISRQSLYDLNKKFTIEEIIKLYKSNNITPAEAKEKVVKIKVKDVTTKDIEELKGKINKTIELIDNLIKKYHNGNISMLDLEQLKEKLK